MDSNFFVQINYMGEDLYVFSISNEYMEDNIKSVLKRCLDSAMFDGEYEALNDSLGKLEKEGSILTEGNELMLGNDRVIDHIVKEKVMIGDMPYFVDTLFVNVCFRKGNGAFSSIRNKAYRTIMDMMGL